MVFAVLTYAWSWAWWVPMAVRGDIVRAGEGWPTHLIGLMGPALAAIATSWLSGGRTEVAELLRACVDVRAPAIAWGAVAGAVALAVVGAVLAERPGDALVYSGAPAIGLWVVPYVLIVNGVGEELGWRGFFGAHLIATRSLRDTSIIVWLVWGIWHLPLFWIVGNFRSFGPAGTFGWVVGLFFGSVFLMWLFCAAGRSVLVVACWHTAYNFATATEAGQGAIAAVATMAVVAATVWIMRTSDRGDVPDRTPRPEGRDP